MCGKEKLNGDTEKYGKWEYSRSVLVTVARQVFAGQQVFKNMTSHEEER